MTSIYSSLASPHIDHATDLVAISHLAFEAVCASTAHNTYRPPAEYWYDQHGCRDQLMCERCVSKLHRYFERHLAKGKHLECKVCHREFEEIDDLFRAVPLGGAR